MRELESDAIDALKKMSKSGQQAAIWIILHFRDMRLFLSNNATSEQLETISKRLKKEKAYIPAALVDLKITLLEHHAIDFPSDKEK